MCNDYAREIEAGRVIAAMEEMKNVPPFSYTGGRIPNDAAPTSHIKIRDRGLIVRLKQDRLEGEMMTWAWLQGKKPIFNFVSEGRDFSKTDRCLILATGFYEYTTPEKPKVKLKDQHFFKMKGQEWFWVAGIVKQDCFAMLTSEPGPDIAPFHDRQICLFTPQTGMDWLTLSKPSGALLKAPPAGTLQALTLRRDGVASAVNQTADSRVAARKEFPDGNQQTRWRRPSQWRGQEADPAQDRNRGRGTLDQTQQKDR